MLSDYERISLQLLAALVGVTLAESGAERREARKIGSLAIEQTVDLLAAEAAAVQEFGQPAVTD